MGSSLLYSQGGHVVLGVERDVEQFGPGLNALMTGGADHLPRHPAEAETGFYLNPVHFPSFCPEIVLLI